MAKKQGAGIIPFTYYNNTLYFLFHKTFKGRRAGLLVDFGGGSNEAESYQQTAVREFIEETEALFFSGDFMVQYKLLEKLLYKTQQQHPDWYCQRYKLKDNSLKNWKTFFVQVEYQTLDMMNSAWANDTAHQFVKRRELLWISADDLVHIIDYQPEKLWTRVRELQDLKSIVLNIVMTYSKVV